MKIEKTIPMNKMSVMLLNKSDEKYLKKCVTGTGLAYGIVIGQVSN